MPLEQASNGDWYNPASAAYATNFPSSLADWMPPADGAANWAYPQGYGNPLDPAVTLGTLSGIQRSQGYDPTTDPYAIKFDGTLAGDGTPLNYNTLMGSATTLPGIPAIPGTPSNSAQYNFGQGLGNFLNAPATFAFNSLGGNASYPGGIMASLANGLGSLIGGRPGTGPLVGGVPGVPSQNVNFNGPTNAFGDIGGPLMNTAASQGLPYGSTGLGGNTGLLGSQYSNLGQNSGAPMSFADWAAYNAWAGVQNPTGAPGIAPSNPSLGTTGATPGGLPIGGPGITTLPPVNSSGTSAPPSWGSGLFDGYSAPGAGNTGGGGGFDPTGNNGLPPYLVNESKFQPFPTPSAPTDNNPVSNYQPFPTTSGGGITPPAVTYPTTTPPASFPPLTNFPGTGNAGGSGGGGGTGGGMGTTGDRNAYPEGLAQNYAEGALAPQQFGQYQQFAPAYARQDAATTGQYLFGQGGPSTFAGQAAALNGMQQDPLLRQQNAIVANLLGYGGNLSPSELRNVQQSSRAGFAARGLDGTNASVVDESMQTDAARRNRLYQDMGLASGVVGQNQAQAGINNSFTANLLGQANNATSTSNAYARNQFDPFNNYGMDLSNTNYNAGQARNIAALNASTAVNIANSNASAAESSANKTAAYNLIGAWLGRCWVAREVYSEDNYQWRLFRLWLETKAPKWFVRLYDRHGPAFARYLKTHPRIKALVRLWMDRKVALARDVLLEEIGHV